MTSTVFASTCSGTGSIAPAAEPHTSRDEWELSMITITEQDWFDLERYAADQATYAHPDASLAAEDTFDAPSLAPDALNATFDFTLPAEDAIDAFFLDNDASAMLSPTLGALGAPDFTQHTSSTLPVQPDANTEMQHVEPVITRQYPDHSIEATLSGYITDSLPYVALYDAFPSPPSLPVWLLGGVGSSSAPSQADDAILQPVEYGESVLGSSSTVSVADGLQPVTRDQVSEQTGTVGSSEPQRCKRKRQPSDDDIWPAPPKKAKCADTSPSSQPCSPSPPLASATPPLDMLVPIVVPPQAGLSCPMPGCGARLAPTDAAWRGHFRSAHHNDICGVPGCSGDCKRSCPLPKENCSKCTVGMSVESIGRHLLNLHMNLRHRCPVCLEEKVQRRSSCQRHIKTCLSRRGAGGRLRT